jgi:hypothetical protein
MYFFFSFTPCFPDVHPLARDANPVTRYDLVANIIHQGKPNDGQYKCHIFHQVYKFLLMIFF